MSVVEFVYSGEFETQPNTDSLVIYLRSLRSVG